MTALYIIKIIFVYILSIFLGIIISSILSIILSKLLSKSVIIKNKNIFHFFLGFFTMVSAFLEATVIIYVFKFFTIGDGFFAIILYALFLLNNDLKRIENIKKNKSPLKIMMMLNQEEKLYNKTLDLKKEYFCLVGGLIGLFLRLFLINL